MSDLEKLTTVEKEVLDYMLQGMSVPEISRARVVSENTTRSQVKNILEKLGVNTQLKAVALVHQHQLVETRKAALKEAGQLVRDHVFGGTGIGMRVADFLDSRAARVTQPTI